MGDYFIVKRRVRGGILATVGYLLSPLSWWNDLVINIPLAYGFGFIFGLISKELFLPMVIIGYWITNIAGLMLMHHGFKDIAFKKEDSYTKKDLIKDLIISILYTLMMVFFIKIGLLKSPLDY